MATRPISLGPKSEVAVKTLPQTIKQFYETWIEKKKPPFVRKSLERDYRQAFLKNILPFMGNLELNSVSVETLENFRLHLVEERKLTLKTARNIIDGSLRAMFRDAGKRVEHNPFLEIPANWWPACVSKSLIHSPNKSVIGFSGSIKQNVHIGATHLFTFASTRVHGLAKHQD